MSDSSMVSGERGDGGESLGGCPSAQLSRYDVRCAAATEDRLAFWQTLREEAPVYYNEDLGLWYVTRYPDVEQVLRSPGVFGKELRRPAQLLPEAREILKSFLDEFVLTFESNPPEQAFFKRIVRAPLLGTKVAEQEPSVRRIANSLIDEFEPDGQADLISVFAYPLPGVHMFEYLGVPAPDLAAIRRESVAQHELWAGFPAPERQVELATQAAAYWDRLKRVATERMESPRDDIISQLVAAANDEGRRMNVFEITSLLRGVVLGAHRTSSHVIGSTIYRLLEDRSARWQRIVADPSLAAAAVNETLRYDSPTVGHFYIAFVDTEIDGQTIRAGERVYVSYLSANHDPAEFEAPDVWDMDRERNTRNLAFGGGIHLCPGTALGRLMVTTAVATLAQRLPELTLREMELQTSPTYFSNGPERLLVGWS